MKRTYGSLEWTTAPLLPQPYTPRKLCSVSVTGPANNHNTIVESALVEHKQGSCFTDRALEERSSEVSLTHRGHQPRDRKSSLWLSKPKFLQPHSTLSPCFFYRPGTQRRKSPWHPGYSSSMNVYIFFSRVNDPLASRLHSCQRPHLPEPTVGTKFLPNVIHTFLTFVIPHNCTPPRLWLPMMPTQLSGK